MPPCPRSSGAAVAVPWSTCWAWFPLSTGSPGAHQPVGTCRWATVGGADWSTWVGALLHASALHPTVLRYPNRYRLTGL